MVVTWFSLTVKCWYRQMPPESNGVQYVEGYQQGAITKGGTVVTHKCIRTESSKFSTFDLQETKIFESSSIIK